MNSPSLGIDIASTSFWAVLWFSPQRYFKQEFASREEGFRRLLSWLRRYGVTELAAGIESTNVYADALAEWLHERGHRVYLLNPERVLRYGQSLGQRNKTDPADARTIAEFVAKHEDLTLWQPLSPEQKKLRDLVRTRAQLVEHHKQISHQLKTAGPDGAPYLQTILAKIKEQLEQIVRSIKAHLRACPRLDQQVKRLMTIKGVGLVTAVVAIAELPPITEQTDPRAICAWAGLIPRRWQSGKLELPARLSRRGNAHLRDALFMPALVAKRHNPLFQTFALRLKEKGKSNGAILGAIAHKLLRTMVGLLKSNTDFNPNWAAKKN